MDCSQKELVLRGSWKGLPKAVRLCGGLLQLDGRLVRRKEGMVLPERGQGLPAGQRRLRDHLTSVRLQCRLLKLAGRLECGQEGLVLQEHRQGLPTSSWWVRLEVVLHSYI